MRYNRYHLLLGFLAIASMVSLCVWVGTVLSVGGGGTFPVKVSFDRAGQLLREGADVKLRGILIGSVTRIELEEGGGVTITMAIEDDHPVPRDITASIRGKTLFGEKFVSLIDEPSPSAQRLGPNDRIPQNKTVDPFELEDVLRTGMPVLNRIEPKDLGGALSALAEGLDGQEEEARRAIDDATVAIRSLDPTALDQLLGGIDESSASVAEAAPSLSSSVEDLKLLSDAIVESGAQTKAVLRDAPRWLGRVGRLMERRHTDLVDLSLLGFDIVELVADHRLALPSTVEGLKNFTQAWVTNLSVGCTASGQSIQTAYPPGGESLKDSTCWQIWNVDGEDQRPPSDFYSPGTWPRPDPSYSSSAYRAQLGTLLALGSGEQPSSVAELMFSAVRGPDGLIPEGLL